MVKAAAFLARDLSSVYLDGVSEWQYFHFKNQVDVRGKPRIIVVLHKSPKKGGIGAGRLHRVDHVVKVAYAPAGGLEGPK